MEAMAGSGRQEQRGDAIGEPFMRLNHRLRSGDLVPGSGLDCDVRRPRQNRRARRQPPLAEDHVPPHLGAKSQHQSKCQTAAPPHPQ